METSEMIGTTVVFFDAYTGAERFGRIDQVFGDDAVIRIIGRDEAGPSPRRVRLKTDVRIAAISGEAALPV